MQMESIWFWISAVKHNFEVLLFSTNKSGGWKWLSARKITWWKSREKSHVKGKFSKCYFSYVKQGETKILEGPSSIETSYSK